MWNVRIARRKVRSFEQCQHQSVVPFVDVGTSGGMHYLAWPMVEGTTLDKIVEKEGKLAPEKAALHVMHAAEGLSLCHQEGLFHGLLKPSNLMLSPEGQVKILDFGIGCLLAETEGESLVDTMSTANSVNSGLDCASPESIMDPTNLNAIGDQYSLGCVMYYCLTGRYPFPDGTAVEKMMSHQHKQPTPVKDLAPEVPDQVIAVVERLMQKVPAARYPGCPELIEALKALTTAAAPAQRRPAATMRALPKLDSVRLAAAQQQKLTMAPPAGEPTPPPELPAKPLLPRSPQALPGRPLQPLPARAPSAAANPPAPLAAPRSVPLPRPSLQRPISPAPAAPAAPAPVPMPRPQSQSLAPRRLAPAPVPEPELEPEPQESEMGYEDQYPDEGYASQPTVGQRLGTFGIVLLAVIAGATAWLLTSFIKL